MNVNKQGEECHCVACVIYGSPSRRGAPLVLLCQAGRGGGVFGACMND
jgi:hypothetical protein